MFADLSELANQQYIYIPYLYCLRGKVADCSQELFEKAYKEEDEQVRQLTEFRLDNIVYEDIDNAEYFIIYSPANGMKASFSNRTSTCYELRGNNLRDSLNLLKNEPAVITLYDALVHLAKNPRRSGYVERLKSLFMGQSVELKANDALFSEESFYLFLSQIHRHADKGGRLRAIFSDYPSINEVNQSVYVLANNIFSGMDIKAILAPIQKLDRKLADLDAMVRKFEKSGQHAAWLAAKTLQTKLNENLKCLSEGAISAVEFKDKCRIAIDNAATSELAKHRGWPGFFSGLTRIISIIASWFGKKTDSFFKLQQIKKVLDDIDLSAESNEPPVLSVAKF